MNKNLVLLNLALFFCPAVAEAAAAPLHPPPPPPQPCCSGGEDGLET